MHQPQQHPQPQPNPQRDSSIINAALALGVSGSRLCQFSDALFSIIATITAVPLAANEAESRKIGDTPENVDQVLKNSIYPIFYCFVSFNIISRSQLWHSIMFDKVENVSVLVILSNALFLLFVSFIPMGYTLLSEASAPLDDDNNDNNDNDLSAFKGASIFFVGLMACVRFSGAFLVYLLPPQHDAFLLCKRRKYLTKQLVGGVCFLFLTPVPLVVMTKANVTFGLPFFWVTALLSLSFANKISDLLMKCFYKYDEEIIHRAEHNSSRRYSTKRVDAFTDGVLAISATLIILDISSCR